MDSRHNDDLLRREELLAHIDEGLRQLDAGEFVEYSSDDDRFVTDIISASAKLRSSRELEKRSH